MLVKSYRACFALSNEIKLTPELQALLLYIQNLYSKYPKLYIRVYRVHILRRHQVVHSVRGDVSMMMRSRDKRAVKNARKQTSLFPMLFRFVFVIAALANWRGKAGGKQVKWKWSCKLIWQAASCESCLCKSMAGLLHVWESSESWVAE